MDGAFQRLWGFNPPRGARDADRELGIRAGSARHSLDKCTEFGGSGGEDAGSKGEISKSAEPQSEASESPLLT